MAGQRHSGRSARSKKKSNVIIWGIVLAILIAAAVLLTANYHEDTKQKLKNASYPQSYSEYVNEAAHKYNLDPALIYAVIRTESGFDPNAHSAAYAYGRARADADHRGHL